MILFIVVIVVIVYFNC